MKNPIRQIKTTGIVASLFFLMLTSLHVQAQQKAAKNMIQKEEISFKNSSWKEVTAEAMKSGKYIFVDAYTSWCGPCKLLKSTTFKDKTAAAYFNKNFINYTVDMEKGEGIPLAKEWMINSYPSLIFFKPDGKMALKQIGYVDGKNLIELGQQAIAKK
ncbi:MULTISPECIES: thioredoxin family protein [Chryseobacterium]|uniref:thioredoxin family protein n=1 Tax=Chryseobacterium TaxID=59732 RepID=UPI001BECF605|nr:MULTISPECIES: thioredoxin family protein [Chryseobacterium]MBT2623454.1 thioredoxin family protein [Chryseobacterium sp. ISL-6]